jgi:hypothetical protein
VPRLVGGWASEYHEAAGAAWTRRWLDLRFWMNFHADWYAFVILCKSLSTTEMKFINWNYLFEIDLPVVRGVEDACRRMNLSSIMSFNCDWNEEVIA